MSACSTLLFHGPVISWNWISRLQKQTIYDNMQPEPEKGQIYCNFHICCLPVDTCTWIARQVFSWGSCKFALSSSSIRFGFWFQVVRDFVWMRSDTDTSSTLMMNRWPVRFQLTWAKKTQRYLKTRACPWKSKSCLLQVLNYCELSTEQMCIVQYVEQVRCYKESMWFALSSQVGPKGGNPELMEGWASLSSHLHMSVDVFFGNHFYLQVGTTVFIVLSSPSVWAARSLRTDVYFLTHIYETNGIYECLREQCAVHAWGAFNFDLPGAWACCSSRMQVITKITHCSTDAILPFKFLI